MNNNTGATQTYLQGTEMSRIWETRTRSIMEQKSHIFSESKTIEF